MTPAEARVMRAAIDFADAGGHVFSVEQMPSVLVHEIYDAVKALEIERQALKVEDDQSLNLAMLVSHTDEKIRIDFQKELRWFAMQKDQAIQFGLLIFQHCGVPVQVTMAPTPAAPAGG